MNFMHTSHASYSLDERMAQAQSLAMTKHHKIELGAAGPSVFPMALGCMGMGAGSWYGTSDDAESIATIHAAIDRGVDVLDTGDFYGMGRNELLIGKALAAGKRDKVLLSVKYGAQIGPDGAFLGVSTHPKATKTALTYSLARLGVDYVDIYRPSRLDPSVPIEETVGAIGELIQAGYVRYLSLSELGAETIRRAAKVLAVADLQIEYSLLSRGPEAKIMPALAELGIAMTAYGVLSRGLLTGTKPSAKDHRAHMPRFSAENAQQNQRLIDALARFAQERGATPTQVAIAWVRAKGTALGVNVVPTMGARTRKQLDDALRGLELTLSREELAALEAAVPASKVAGTRYPAPGMLALDSER